MIAVSLEMSDEPFLFPIAKIGNIYHIDNQFIIISNLFRDCP